MPLRIAIAGLFLTICPIAVSAETCQDSAAIAHRDRATRYYLSHQLPEAIGEIREAIRSCPDNYFYHFMLGNALYRSNNLEAARESYQKALELRPGHFEARVSLGFTLFELGDRAEANRQWLAAIRLEPESPLARAVLALGLYSVGDRDNAVIQYQEAGRLDSRYSDPQALSADIRWKPPALKILSQLKELAAQPEEEGR